MQTWKLSQSLKFCKIAWSKLFISGIQDYGFQGCLNDCYLKTTRVARVKGQVGSLVFTLLTLLSPPGVFCPLYWLGLDNASWPLAPVLSYAGSRLWPPSSLLVLRPGQTWGSERGKQQAGSGEKQPDLGYNNVKHVAHEICFLLSPGSSKELKLTFIPSFHDVKQAQDSGS